MSLLLDYRLSHILIDEFQDTASPQIQLLRKLTAGWQNGDGRSLFIVGDGMQSCYGFRDANVGLFLDARPIRGWLRENSSQRRVLNLFAYTGSLGVAAAAGGARSVVHLDKKRGPLDLARENHRVNGLPVDGRGFLAGDVYQHLPRAARSGASFDAIILDPPPRVHRRKGATGAASQDFAELTRLSTALLDSGGWLLCFFHRFDRGRAAFEAEVLESAICPLSVLWRGGSGEDFPEPNPEHALRVTAFARP